MAEPLPYPFPRPQRWASRADRLAVHGDPLVPVVLPSGDRAVLLTRYRDVRQVLTDDRLSRNLNRPDAARISLRQQHVPGPAINPDPPGHTRVRNLVAKAFTAARVKQLEPQIQTIVDELLDRMEQVTAPPT